MEWLNYHHLLYFWTIVREGGISRAAEKLRLAQPTVSAQLRTLEDSLGEKLFDRRGRTLQLTDTGRLVYRYADEIFGLGRELQETLRGQPGGRPATLTVGVTNAVPKLVVSRLLRPLIARAHRVRLTCHEGHLDQLLSEIATHALDVVIADAPAPPHVRVKVFNHLLGESTTSFYAHGRTAAALRRRFPRSLHGAPMLLPTLNSALRRAIDGWFEREQIRPEIVGEFDDSALMKSFGESVDVVFPAPTAIERDVRRNYGVTPIGVTDAVSERYYAISVERRVKHPEVLAITSAARADLFG